MCDSCSLYLSTRLLVHVSMSGSVSKHTSVAVDVRIHLGKCMRVSVCVYERLTSPRT